MTTWELVAEKTKDLPPDKQQEVLDFVEFVRGRKPDRKPRRSSEGLCADLGVDITEEDVAQARREIRGTRIMVSVILDYLGAGESHDAILQEYPQLGAEDIRAVLAYVSPPGSPAKKNKNPSGPAGQPQETVTPDDTWFCHDGPRRAMRMVRSRRGTRRCDIDRWLDQSLQNDGDDHSI